MSNNQVVLGCGLPFEQRVGQAVGVWIREGRDHGHLLTGKAFFAVYSWYFRHRTGLDIAQAEFVTASYRFNGGSDGWNAMLRLRTTCESCQDTFRLENIGVCTGCMRYTCYACGAHGSCAGEIV
ncbi:hypothetical protein OHA98_13370 [Streptomyces sp. NBC_00654]|uniref:hypothetical protein n=1 Tax=Streptomyces sp. NBC_00654 TaxID=2975799 RepID=UPI002253C768|nr:hypothetical protein [Streptomyces sp. NBC_00654]MCX4965810.1 hypothetical protein [Streptomyces sp. NBC_00654]